MKGSQTDIRALLEKPNDPSSAAEPLRAFLSDAAGKTARKCAA